MVGVETRFREVERRLFAAYGLTVSGELIVEMHDPRGVRARVQMIGDGDAAPVVFVNGISAPGAGFAPLLPLLATGRKLMLVDLPGHALAPAYSWWDGQRPLRELAVAIVTGIVDALAIGRASIVANSLGGMFALWTAVDAPQRVRAVAALGEPAVALPGARGNVAMGMLTAPVAGRAFQLAMAVPAPRAALKRTMAAAIGWPAVANSSNDLLDIHALAVRQRGQAASFRSLLRRILDGRTPRPENVLTTAELERITAPVLFVWGDNDVFLSPQDGSPSVARMSNARLEIVPGGHDPWIDDPPRCGRLVADFLDDID